MERIRQRIIETTFSQILLEIKYVGDDVLIIVGGGNKPHIGCVSISIPLLSLKGDGKQSCTSSVWNMTGHKDEAVCRKLSEAYCKKTGKMVVCTGGIHFDDVQPEQIEELMEKLDIFIQNEWR